MNFKKPYLIKETRVWRLYKGGKLLDQFHNKPNPIDDFFPEDWIGSVTSAVNIGRENIKDEGLSKIIIDNKEIYLKDILKDRNNAIELLGEKHLDRYKNNTQLLVKLLDSSIRLPLQTHPDKEFAKKHLNSNYGKTETWIILGTRKIKKENAYVYFGFKENVSKKEFDKYYYKQDIDKMTSLLNKIYVKPGDVFVIPANLIHAIGPGVFLMEIQEPSDHVFQFDKKTEYWKLNNFQIHMNLGDEKMLNTIDYSLTGNNVLNKYYKKFNINSNNQSITEILPDFIKNYFMCNFIVSKNLTRTNKNFSIGIVISGKGIIKTENGNLNVKKGNAYIIPGSAKNITYISDNNNLLKILEANPPVET